MGARHPGHRAGTRLTDEMEVAKTTACRLPSTHPREQSPSLCLDKRTTISDWHFLHRNRDDDLKLRFSSPSAPGLRWDRLPRPQTSCRTLTSVLARSAGIDAAQKGPPCWPSKPCSAHRRTERSGEAASAPFRGTCGDGPLRAASHGTQLPLFLSPWRAQKTSDGFRGTCPSPPSRR